MKYTSLPIGLLFVLLFMPVTAQAQFSFGVGAGLNFTSLADVDFGSTRTVYDSRSGYHVGAFLDFSAGPIALRPGVYYMNAGTLFEDGFDSVSSLNTIDDNFELNFVVVPIDVRLRLGIPLLKPYIHAGPELRFRSEDASTEVEEALDLRSFNLAGNFGGGGSNSTSAVCA